MKERMRACYVLGTMEQAPRGNGSGEPQPLPTNCQLSCCGHFAGGHPLLTCLQLSLLPYLTAHRTECKAIAWPL